MLPLVLTGVIVLISILILSRKRSSDLPGPPQLPVLGNLLYVLKEKKLLELLLRWRVKYGDTFSIKLPFQKEWIVITRPEEVEHILKTNFENYVKGEDFRSKFEDLLGHGIFAVDGETWKEQRKISSNIFSINNFKENMLVVFRKHSSALLDVLREFCDGGGSIDMHDLMHRFTMDSICEIAFAVNLDSLHKEVAFTKSFDWAQTNCSMRFFRPFWRFHPSEVTHSRHIRIVRSFCESIVSARIEAQKSDEAETHDDLLSLFMSRTDSNGNSFSQTYLRDVIANFIIAGRDTTAQLLSWTIWLISLNPRVENKLREEVDREPDVFDYDASKRMQYTSAILHEALRLYPSVPKDAVFAVKDDVLPNGVKVPQGTMVAFSPYCMGRDPNLYENPLEFHPERWLDSQGHMVKINAFKYPNFKAGPRTCLGQNMAIMEAQCVLRHLYSLFTFRLAPDAPPVTYKESTTMPMANGLVMIVTPRPGL